jgi:hypothetical protein
MGEKIKLFPMIGRKSQAKAVDMPYTILFMLSVIRDSSEHAVFDTDRVNITKCSLESEVFTA